MINLKPHFFFKLLISEIEAFGNFLVSERLGLEYKFEISHKMKLIITNLYAEFQLISYNISRAPKIDWICFCIFHLEVIKLESWKSNHFFLLKMKTKRKHFGVKMNFLRHPIFALLSPKNQNFGMYLILRPVGKLFSPNCTLLIKYRWWRGEII